MSPITDGGRADTPEQRTVPPDPASPSPARRGGRRPGRPETREQVLLAAREAFATSGFAGATMRQIAASAGVDPALIHHYFGSKRQLFMEAVRAPEDPQVVMRSVLAGDRDGAGRRMVVAFLGVWDGAAGGQAAAVLRSAVTDASSAVLVREFLLTQVLLPLLDGLGVARDERPLRAALLASQLTGLALTRHLLQLPPLATAPVDVVVDAIGPVLQRYLTGELRPHESDQPPASAPPDWKSGPGL